MKFLLFLLSGTAAFAAVQPGLLDRPVTNLRLEQAPLPAALRSLARACQTNIVIDPEVKGEVTVEIAHGTLRSALAALTQPGGYSFEETSDGLAVHNRRTVLYTIDYPQLTRSGSGSASITLGGTNSGSGSYGANGQVSALPQTLGGNGQIQAGSDATQVSISQENQTTFWTGLEAELKAMLGDGDTLILNKFSGVAQITTSAPRHRTIYAFIQLVNHRITQQVEIEARIVEVALTDEKKLGVDWDLAATTAGSVQVDGSAPLEATGVGGTLLAANTFAANLGFGRATAVIHALAQQGNVKTVAQPKLRALNNQTAFIKIGEDRPFFRLQQSTTFQSGGTAVPVNQTQESFSVSTITIGTVLAVTPQIDANGIITLDVLPAITRLQSVVTSPDGRQTAPVTEIKQASTIVRLKDGETAIIGGLISEDGGQTTRAVPVLSAVPVLGQAFRSKAVSTRRTELVIFLTPKLIR